MKMIWFDMDGTIYNLYKIPGWLEKLEARDMSVFAEGEYARKSLPRIREAVSALRECGWCVGVITWSPIGVKRGTDDFGRCAYEKFDWLEQNFPELMMDDMVACLEYGESKSAFAHEIVPNADYQLLIDDNKMVRDEWRKRGDAFHTINANRGYVKELMGLVG